MVRTFTMPHKVRQYIIRHGMVRIAKADGQSKFEREYFTNLINAYVRWEADDRDLQVYFEDGVDYMNFPLIFANDCSVILDAGEYKLYIEWGINECPVYVDIDGEYTRIGRVRNSRFWVLVERFKNR